MGKLTKAQRRKLLDPNLVVILAALPDDELLAAHDLMHDLMEHRHGTNKRAEAGRLALQEAQGRTR